MQADASPKAPSTPKQMLNLRLFDWRFNDAKLPNLTRTIRIKICLR
jgi:hypothetical protein